jgi:hypothetical protein
MTASLRAIYHSRHCFTSFGKTAIGVCVCAQVRAREPVDGVIITGIRSLLPAPAYTAFPLSEPALCFGRDRPLLWHLPFLYSAISFVNNCHLFEYFIQAINRLTTGWTVRGSNPGAGENFRTCLDRPWGPSSLLYDGYRVFPGGRKRPRRDAYHSPLLVPWSKNRLELYLHSPSGISWLVKRVKPNLFRHFIINHLTSGIDFRVYHSTFLYLWYSDFYHSNIGKGRCSSTFQTNYNKVIKVLKRYEALAAVLLYFPVMTISRNYTQRLNRKSQDRIHYNPNLSQSKLHWKGLGLLVMCDVIQIIYHCRPKSFYVQKWHYAVFL